MSGAPGMVRLTIELIRASPQFQNPCKQRELDVRGNKIPAVENMGATDNQFEVIDLSDNELTKLQNFGRLDRLVSILANNNKISRVGELPPSVDSVILTNNRLTSLGDLAALGELPALRTLSLLKNPVARQQHYREYLVHLCPKLRFLDFQLLCRSCPSRPQQCSAVTASSSISRARSCRISTICFWIK